MNIKNILFLLLCTSFALPAVANDAGVSGQIKLRPRHDNPKEGDSTDRVQARLEINAFLGLDENGCYEVHAKGASGNGFTSYYNETGIFGDKDENLDFNLQHAWKQFNCVGDHGTVSVGVSLPMVSDGFLGGKRSGGRVDYGVRYDHNNQEQGYQWTVTAGQIKTDDIKEADLFSREWDGYNYYQVTGAKSFGEHTVMADYTRYDSNNYLRSAVSLAVEQYTGGTIDELAFEEFLVNGKQQGHIVQAKKKMGPWSVKVGASNIKEFRGRAGTTQLPNESKYGIGQNYHMFVKRKDAIGPVDIVIFLRDGDAGFRSDAEFVYHFKSKRTAPPFDFDRDEDDFRTSSPATLPENHPMWRDPQ